jgi:hypothetical protein
MHLLTWVGFGLLGYVPNMLYIIVNIFLDNYYAYLGRSEKIGVDIYFYAHRNNFYDQTIHKQIMTSCKCVHRLNIESIPNENAFLC